MSRDLATALAKAQGTAGTYPISPPFVRMNGPAQATPSGHVSSTASRSPRHS